MVTLKHRMIVLRQLWHSMNNLGGSILSYKVSNLAITVGYRDTFCIPFAIINRPMLEQESFLFTVRRTLDGTNRKGRSPERSGIVFQKKITWRDVTPIIDEEGNNVGCEFFVKATKADAELIPMGACVYDLALINSQAGVEIELVPPSVFMVGEVLRYD